MLGGPLPLQVGGGKCPAEAAYDQLRQAVGIGGSAVDDLGIEGLWRWSKAIGLAAASSPERRAFLQAFPWLATDATPYYERLLRIVPPSGSTDAERAEVASQRFYESPIASTPELEAGLQLIDPRLSLMEPPDGSHIETQMGRAFESQNTADELPAFNLAGGRGYSNFPAYATSLVVRVLFDLGYAGAPTTSDQRIIERVRDFLRGNISSVSSFTISTGPWVIGVTPIGLGAVA